MIASGNHLLTQVKDNQPSLRRSLEQGTAGTKAERLRPSAGPKAEIDGKPGNSRCSRPRHAYAATPWEKLIKTVLRLERTVCKRDPEDRTLQPQPPRLSSGCPPPLAIAAGKLGTNGYAATGASRMAATTCATSLSPRTPPASARTPTSPPACDPSPTIIIRASGGDNVRNTRWRAALDHQPNLSKNHRHLIEN